MTKNAPIAEKLSIGNNSFGLLRFIAATAVVISHAWLVTSGSYSSEPLLKETGFTLGWHAVNLFFSLSGLLIARSLHHSRSMWQFVWSRFLRIFPALVTVICVTLFAAALLVDGVALQLTATVEYLVRNLLLVGAGATLPGVFANNPKPDVINVPLWTLKYEVMAYASIVILAILAKRIMGFKDLRLFTILILLVTAGTMMSFGTLDTHGKLEHAVRLTFAFYLGVAAWQWRHRFRVSGFDFLLISIANVSLLLTQVQLPVLHILWLAYGGLWLGTRTYGRISRFTDRQDYSYGIYIIGFPVQQAVVSYAGTTDPWTNIAISLPIILILAYCSWNFIEKPALKLKKSLPRLSQSHA